MTMDLRRFPGSAAAWTVSLLLALLAASWHAAGAGQPSAQPGAPAPALASRPARLLANLQGSAATASAASRLARRAPPVAAGGWLLMAGSGAAVGLESTRWPTPFDVMAARQLSLGQRNVVAGIGLRGWCDRPQERSGRWGVRVTLTFVLAH